MPRTLGLRGIDISQHQGAGVLSDTSGLSFVVLRATIGTVVDTDYAAFYAKARAAGLVVMAYHFGYPEATVSVDAQVERFLGVAKDADFLWIDQEQAGFDDAQTQRFVDLVRAKGKAIGLYHSASGFGGVNADARWVADYRESSIAAGYPRNTVTGAEMPWDLWQWSSTGSRPGYVGNVDLDWLNPASPLAGLLRKGYVTTKQFNELDAITQATIRTLQNDVKAANLRVTELTTQLDFTAKELAKITEANVALGAALDAAPGIERERIAQAIGAAEAERIRNAQ